MLVVDRVEQPRRVAEVEILERANELIAIVGEGRAAWNSILSLKAPTLPLSSGSIRIEELLGRQPSRRSSASVMLPLVSSMTTTVIGVDLVVERGERLRLAVVVDLEVLLRQAG